MKTKIVIFSVLLVLASMRASAKKKILELANFLAQRMAMLYFLRLAKVDLL
ncbi:MAG: hypothetical protein QNK30_16470 [Bacteroidales bacterium]|nr:hypothetical protein [Bacteroidales bacterium]